MDGWADSVDHNLIWLCQAMGTEQAEILGIPIRMVAVRHLTPALSGHMTGECEAIAISVSGPFIRYWQQCSMQWQ